MYTQYKLPPSRSSSSSVCSESFVIEEIRRLSKEQRRAIQETFKCLSCKPVENGHNIFVRLFTHFPEYKEIWPQFRGIPDSAIISADAIKAHGFVYMGGLKTIIDNMENEDRMAEMISRIAVSHLKWNIRKQHVMNMLPEVITVLRSNLGCQDSFVEEAWSTLYDVIGNLVDRFKEIQLNEKKQHNPIQRTYRSA